MTTNRVAGAARDFEAFLISDMMRRVREGGSEDQTMDAAFGLAENEFARAMSAAGGFGLAKLIEKGLTSPAEQSPSPHQS